MIRACRGRDEVDDDAEGERNVEGVHVFDDDDDCGELVDILYRERGKVVEYWEGRGFGVSSRWSHDHEVQSATFRSVLVGPVAHPPPTPISNLAPAYTTMLASRSAISASRVGRRMSSTWASVKMGPPDAILGERWLPGLATEPDPPTERTMASFSFQG